ncbi:Cytochrome c-like domain containing protein [Fimbriimonadaceae bacterium]
MNGSVKLSALGFTAALIIGIVAFSPTAQAKQQKKPEVVKTTVNPFVKKYCVSCHGAKDPADGVNLTGLKTDADVKKAAKMWKKAGREVLAKKMPPQGSVMPKDEERKKFIDALNSLK